MNEITPEKSSDTHIAARGVWFEGNLPYPLVVARSRYGGVYEGGQWIAFNRNQVPDDATGSDVECAEFWGRLSASDYLLPPDDENDPLAEPLAAGVGATAQEAIDNLVAVARRVAR